MNAHPDSLQADAVPLCLEFEGTLTPVSLQHERRLGTLKRSTALFERLLRISAAGAGSNPERIQPASAELEALPLRDELLQWLQQQRASGRRIVLVGNGDRELAEQLATRFGLFDAIVETAGGTAADRRRALVERFGERGFDFVGSEFTDEAIWAASRQAIVVGDSTLARRIGRTTQVERQFAVERPTLKTWIKAIRLHQWVKNGLIFLPLLLAHRVTDLAALKCAALAFLAFGCCASSVYVLNDLLDLEADRQHPRKRRRPFAAGLLSARAGIRVAILLLLCAAGLSALVGTRFAAMLAGYYLLTWSYSIRLKRVALLDVMMLAGLYTMRLIAGSAATSIELSFWLLAFSVFIFLSLGFVKRYAELYDAVKAGKLAGHGGRGYSADDLPLILTLGTAAGYCGIIVMALYVNSVDSLTLYKHHKVLWLLCPVMLFWISRVWMLTARGQMHDDPVVFALRDRASLMIVALMGLIVLLSI